MTRTITLNKLVRSPRNVRRSSDEQADAQLKADIAARGLLQNLVVLPVKKPKGCFAVEAGDRRFRALKSLAEDGTIGPAHEVACFVVEDGEIAAQEASLAENFQRLRLNPADECLAFQQLIDQGADVEGIARRFGLGVRFVEGRLRLASLAPIIFEALGAGEISLDVAKAYAAVPDQERQAFVFEQIGRGYGGAHPDSIRRLMTQATVSGADRRALFVGEEAYVAAGGRIECDLFSDGSAARWLDIALLERLACEKMKAAASATAAELGIGEVRLTLDHRVSYDMTDGLERLPVEREPLSDDELLRIDGLEGEIGDLADLLESGALDERSQEEAEARLATLSSEIRTIASKPPVVDEESRAKAVAFLLLDEQGHPRLDATYYVAADERVESGAPALDPDTANDAASPAGKKIGISQRLIDELAMQRRDILAVHIAGDPGMALDLAIFLMVDGETSYRFERRGLSLHAPVPSDPVFDFKTPDAAATIARAELREALDRSWTEAGTLAERFDAFRLLPDGSRAAWLGYAVARSLEASLGLPGERACPFHDHLGRLLGIDVAQWWRPTGSNYFDRVPKEVTLAALEAIGGPALAARYGKAKKAELAQSCERIFSGDFIGAVEEKEAALAWLPDAMRFAPAGQPAPSFEDRTADDGAEEELASAEPAGSDREAEKAA